MSKYSKKIQNTQEFKQLQNIIKRFNSGVESLRNDWAPSSGKYYCPVCGEDYIRSRRLSRSLFSEYDHGTWVCKK